ncbi:MAG: xanthine dehydrogenase family protein subunit M [Thermodesulfobacteriota bacterium]
MPNQQFVSPTDLREACSILCQAKGKIAILAGGTDLMPRFNTRRPAFRPDVLLYLGGLHLDYIRLDGQTLVIGACATHEDIVNSDHVRKHAPLLAKACSEIGCPAIRNAGTIGGNVCNRAPYADGTTALMALDASMVIATESGDRGMKLEDFVTYPLSNFLKPGEILKEIHIPMMLAEHKWGWLKQGQRRGSSISVAAVAVRMKMHDRACSDARIAAGAVAPTPFVSKSAPAILEGQPLSESLAEKAGAAVSEEADPQDDSRASAWYRKKLVGVLVKRTLTALA